MHKAYSENYLNKSEEALESCKKALDMVTEYANKTIDKDESGNVLKPITKDEIDEQNHRLLDFIFQEKGTALEKLKQYDDAIECYKKLLKGNKKDIFPLIRIIRCLGELGRINEQKEYRSRLNKLEDE